MIPLSVLNLTLSNQKFNIDSVFFVLLSNI